MCEKLDIIIWISIIILFIISFIGLIVPIIPGVLVLWGGFLLYHFTLDADSLSIWFWLAIVAMTIMMFVADFVTNHYFVQKLGGSKASQWGAVVGVLIGVFVYPPIGMITVPFLVVFLIELTYRKTVRAALLAAIGALAGFLSGAIAKGLIQVVMIVWFIIDILL